MKRVLILFCVVVMVFSTTFTTAAKPSFINNFEWEVLKLTNTERTNAGLLPLSTFDTLQNAADVRATEIERQFSHTRPDGSDCFSAIDEAGVAYFSAGENIAMAQSSPAQVVTAWMNSPGHRENILTNGFKHLAVGYEYIENSECKHHWVQLFVGGCNTTAIAIEGDHLRVSCDMHNDSYVPLENVQTEALPDGTIKAYYDGKTTTAGAPAPEKPLDDTSVIFTDVIATEWYKQFVDYAYTHKIFKGNEDGTFKPLNNITRAEFVQVLANISSVDTQDKNIVQTFTDVVSGDWFAPAVMWAYNNGIVAGYGAEFKPNENITREQMCVMIVNYAEKYKGIALDPVETREAFYDDRAISDWAKDAVYACQMADIVNGKGDHDFDPQGTGLRAEASVIFTKLHKNYLN